MSNNIKLVIGFFLIIAILIVNTVIIFYVSNKQNKILQSEISGLKQSLNEQLSSQNSSLNEQLSNQTALLYRTIGDVLPVIVPEEKKTEFALLKEKTESLLDFSNNESSFEEVSELYSNFVKHTAPWIQDELFNEIVFVKDTIDYVSILSEYEKSKDIDVAIMSLSAFISQNENYDKISEVQEKCNALIKEKNDKYNATIADLNEEMSKAFSSKSTDLAFWEGIIQKIEPYSDNTTLSENIRKLQDYYADANLYNETYKELETIDVGLNIANDDEAKEESYSVYADRIALCKYNIESIQFLTKDNLQKKLQQCSEKLVVYDVAIKRRQEKELAVQLAESTKVQEQEIANQITQSIKLYSAEIDKLQSNAFGSEMVNVLASQLASMKATAQSFTVIDSKATLQEIDKSVERLTAKEIEIEKNLVRKQENDVVKQITKGIQDCKSEIEKLDTSIVSQEKLSVLATQLVSLELATKDLVETDNAELLSSIKTCEDSLKAKEIALSQSVSNKNESDLKLYNQRALSVIEDVNSRFCNKQLDKGLSKEKKEERRINLLIQLEMVQVNYLYLSVGTLYQQVYQEIWSSIDSNSRFEVSRRTISVNKWGLYDQF